MEDPAVFQAVHAAVFRFMSGAGSRPAGRPCDGLMDPPGLFDHLGQREPKPAVAIPRRLVKTAPAGRPPYLVVEKILSRDEICPRNGLSQGPPATAS